MARKTVFKKVAVLMGGVSAEREVSLKTGEAVLDALLKLGYKAKGIDADRKVAKVLLKEAPEAVFIALHGRFGEDGTIQGMLELLEIPYCGSGVLASALAMDKIMSKKIFRQEDIPVAIDIPCCADDFKNNRNDVIERVAKNVPLPLIVKPSREGSTIGVTIVKRKEDIGEALDTAFHHDNNVLAEQFIEGKLVTVALIGREPKPLPVIEVVPKSGFYDYEAKYTSGMTEYICPARLPEDISAQLKEIAVQAHNSLDCEDVSRVDMILSDENEVFVLEVNTIPGMTETSLVPKAARAHGLDFPELVDEILSGAYLKLKPG